jgi:Family of unknown function (DUF6011)
MIDLDTFALAGHAIFTAHNPATGNRFTYKVSQCDDKPDLYFVGVLTGPDNTNDYQYLGTIRDTQYTHGRKSRIGADAPSAKAFDWLWRHRDRLPPSLDLHHEGRCCRCGRLLTVPESVTSGVGPECAKKMS